MTPSTITHRGMSVEISDDLTLRIASLLWEDLSKEWAVNGNIPKDAPKVEIKDEFAFMKTEPIVFTRDLYPLSIPGVNLPEEKQPEPEKPPINRTLGGKGYTFVRNAPTLAECFTKFPNVPRANIERIWYNAHAPVKEEPKPKSIEIVPGTDPEVKITIAPKKGYSKAHNMDSGRWTDDETELLRLFTPVDRAILFYREKFPDSKRNDNAVRQKFNKLHQPGQHNGATPKYIKPAEKKTQTPNKTQLGGIVLPDELKPLEEKKSFFVGAQVRQIAGHPPHAFGTGDIIEIKANGDIVVEFYHGKKILKRDEIAFYSTPRTVVS